MIINDSMKINEAKVNEPYKYGGKWYVKDANGNRREVKDPTRKSGLGKGLDQVLKHEKSPKNVDKIIPNKNKSINNKRDALTQLNNYGGNASSHIEDLAMKYQPDAGSFDDLTDDTISKIYKDLTKKYKDDIDRYGDDAEIDSTAYKLLDLN